MLYLSKFCVKRPGGNRPVFLRRILCPDEKRAYFTKKKGEIYGRFFCRILPAGILKSGPSGDRGFSNPVLLVTVALTLGVIFVNGWTDAPNAIATCIATRCLKVRTAIMMSAVFNFLGVLVMTKINSSVASTISNMVDFGGQTDAALIALCAASRCARLYFPSWCTVWRLRYSASRPARATA